MSVSCGGYSTDISGIDMIFGDSSVSEQVEYFSDGENDGSLFNWFILFAGLFYKYHGHFSNKIKTH